MVAQPWAIDPVQSRDPARDCNEPPLFDYLFKLNPAFRVISVDPDWAAMTLEEAIDFGQKRALARQWVKVDREEAAAAVGIEPKSVLVELTQMARRGTIELDRRGDDLWARPTRGWRTYLVRSRRSH